MGTIYGQRINYTVRRADGTGSDRKSGVFVTEMPDGGSLSDVAAKYAGALGPDADVMLIGDPFPVEDTAALVAQARAEGFGVIQA